MDTGIRHPFNYDASNASFGMQGRGIQRDGKQRQFEVPGQDRTGLSLALHLVVTILILGGSATGGLLLTGDFFVEPSSHPGYPGVASWANAGGVLLLVLGIPLGMVSLGAFLELISKKNPSHWFIDEALLAINSKISLNGPKLAIESWRDGPPRQFPCHPRSPLQVFHLQLAPLGFISCNVTGACAPYPAFYPSFWSHCCNRVELGDQQIRDHCSYSAKQRRAHQSAWPMPICTESHARRLGLCSPSSPSRPCMFCGAG